MTEKLKTHGVLVGHFGSDLYFTFFKFLTRNGLKCPHSKQHTTQTVKAHKQTDKYRVLNMHVTLLRQG